MDRLFGKAKEKAPKPTIQDATGSLEKRGDSVDQKIMKLDKELMRYVDQMKKMKPGPAKAQVQKRAAAILKQKKMYENQKSNMMDQAFNLDQIAFATEGIKETANTVSAMKDANKDLKKQMKNIKIDQVEDMQDDLADLLEQAEEIQGALGRSYGTDDIDEADLEAELAALEDDPSLFMSMGDETAASADYLDLPATSTAEVGGVEEKPAEDPSAVPAATS